MAAAMRAVHTEEFIFLRDSFGQYKVFDWDGNATGEAAYTFVEEGEDPVTMAVVDNWAVFADHILPALDILCRCPNYYTRGNEVIATTAVGCTWLLNPPSAPIAYLGPQGQLGFLSHSFRARIRELAHVAMNAGSDYSYNSAIAEISAWRRLILHAATAALDTSLPFNSFVHDLVNGRLRRGTNVPPFVQLCVVVTEGACFLPAARLTEVYVPQSGKRPVKEPHHPPASWKKIQDLQRVIAALEARIKHLEAARDAARRDRSLKPQAGVRAITDALADPGTYNAALLAIVGTGVAIASSAAISVAISASRASRAAARATEATEDSLGAIVRRLEDFVNGAVSQITAFAGYARQAAAVVMAVVAVSITVQLGRDFVPLAMRLIRFDTESIQPQSSAPIWGMATAYAFFSGDVPKALKNITNLSNVFRGVDFVASHTGNVVDWVLENITKGLMWFASKTPLGVPTWLVALHEERFGAYAKYRELYESITAFNAEYALGRRTDMLANICYLRDLQHDLDSIKTLSLFRGGDPQTKLDKLQTTLTATCNAVQAKTAACGDIPEPVAVGFVGAPGAGKSLMSKTFLTDVIARCLPRQHQAVEALDPTVHVWSRPTGSRYADGYTGQFAVLVDDFNISRLTQDPDTNDPSWVVRYVNTSPTQMNMAELSKKGSTPFTSRLVVLTSNFTNISEPNVEQALHTAGAFQRRLPYYVDFSPKPGFSRNDRLDYKAYLNHVRGGGSLDDVWLLTVKEWDGLNGRPGTETSYSALLDDVVADIKSRLADYNTLVELRRDRYARWRAGCLEPASGDVVPQAGWRDYLRSFFSGAPSSDGNGDLPTPPTGPKKEALSVYHPSLFAPNASTSVRSRGYYDPSGRYFTGTHRDYRLHLTGRRSSRRQRLLADYPDMWLLYVHTPRDSFDWAAAEEQLTEVSLSAGIKRAFINYPLQALRDSKDWFFDLLGAEYSYMFVALSMATVMGVLIPVFLFVASSIIDLVLGAIDLVLRFLGFKKKQKTKNKVRLQAGVNRDGAVPDEVAAVAGNQYSLVVNQAGLKNAVGHVLALGGRKFLCNKHFSREHSDVYELCNRDRTITVSHAAFQQAFLTSVSVASDLCVVAFEGPGVSGYPMHKDITHLIISKKDAAHPTCYNDTLIHSHNGKPPYVDVFQHKAATFREQINVDCATGEETWVNLLSIKGSLGYGYCGSLMFVRTPAGWRLTASYAAGSETPRTGSGFFVVFNREVLAIKPSSGWRDDCYRGEAIPPVHVSRCSKLRADATVVAELGALAPTKIPAQLAVRDGVDPLYKALDKYMIEPPDFTQGQYDKVHAAAMAVLNNATSSTPVPPNRPVLSYEEAVMGVFSVMDPLPRDTSAGYPYCGSKDPRVDVPCSSVRIDQRKGILLNPLTTEGAAFKARVLSMVESLRGGHVVPLYYVAFLKDETRKPEKVASCDTRLICGAALELCVLWRMFFGAYEAWLKQGHTFNGMCVGINPLGSDWAFLTNYLGGIDHHVFAGDYTGFDTRQHAGFFAPYGAAANAWYASASVGDSKAREALCRMLTRPRVVVGDKFYELKRGLPSGHPGTACINSFTNLVLLKLCYDDLAAEQAKSPPPFFAVVRPAVWGDDNVVSAPSDVLAWYNQNTIGRAMDAYGFTYTPEDKSGSAPDWRKLGEVSFLKRGFSRGPDGTAASPLEVTSILNALVWSRRNMPPHEVLLKFRAALVELSQHDECVWSKYAPPVFRACVATTQLTPEFGCSPEDQRRWYSLKSTYPDPTALWHR